MPTSTLRSRWVGPRGHAQPLSGMVAAGHRGAGGALRGGRRVRAGHEGPGRDGCREPTSSSTARRPARDADELPAHGHVRALAAHAGSGRHVRRTGDGDTGPPGRGSTLRPRCSAASTSGAGANQSLDGLRDAASRPASAQSPKLDRAWDVPPIVAADGSTSRCRSRLPASGLAAPLARLEHLRRPQRQR